MKSIKKMIDDYTNEAGVRELERLLATIIRKIVKDIVIDKGKDNYKISKFLKTKTGFMK